MTQKRVRTQCNKAESSKHNDCRSFFEKLSGPLLKIVESIDENLSSENRKKSWPTNIQFTTAEMLIKKQGAVAVCYLEDVFYPAWKLAKQYWENPVNEPSSPPSKKLKRDNPETKDDTVPELPTEIIEFEEVIETFSRNKTREVVIGRLLTATVIQRWGITNTVNPAAPACFILMQKKRKDLDALVVVMKVWSKSELGKRNYDFFASLPFGAKISIHRFEIQRNDERYLKSFATRPQIFEIVTSNAFVALNSNIEAIPMELSIADLSMLRASTKIEGVVELYTTGKHIGTAKQVLQYVEYTDSVVNRYSVDIFDFQGSIGKMSFWEKDERIQQLKAFRQKEEIKIRISIPGSIKVIDGVLCISVTENVTTVEFQDAQETNKSN